MRSSSMAAKASKRSRRGQAGRPKQPAGQGKGPATGARTMDAALIRKMLSSDCSEKRHLLVQDLIYNLSGELCSLAYHSGFNLGAEAYRNSNKTLDALGRLLSNAGLGMITFRPFEYHGIITAYGIDSHRMNLGTNIHEFEAGIIAGYLSAHARKRIIVKELVCAYNGAGFCQFIASASPGTAKAKGKQISPDRLARLVELDMRSSAGLGTSKPYYSLFNKPLVHEPVLGSASKLMYLVGIGLAKSTPQTQRDFERGVIRIANYLGIERARVASSRDKGQAIYLSYDHYGSTSGFVELTTAMLAGFSKGVFNKNVYVQRRLGSRRNYLVRMFLMPAAARRSRVRP
jgi:hypothetical protein